MDTQILGTIITSLILVIGLMSTIRVSHIGVWLRIYSHAHQYLSSDAFKSFAAPPFKYTHLCCLVAALLRGDVELAW